MSRKVSWFSVNLEKCGKPETGDNKITPDFRILPISGRHKISAHYSAFCSFQNPPEARLMIGNFLMSLSNLKCGGGGKRAAGTNALGTSAPNHLAVLKPCVTLYLYLCCDQLEPVVGTIVIFILGYQYWEWGCTERKPVICLWHFPILLFLPACCPCVTLWSTLCYSIARFSSGIIIVSFMDLNARMGLQGKNSTDWDRLNGYIMDQIQSSPHLQKYHFCHRHYHSEYPDTFVTLWFKDIWAECEMSAKRQAPSGPYSSCSWLLTHTTMLDWIALNCLAFKCPAF